MSPLITRLTSMRPFALDLPITRAPANVTGIANAIRVGTIVLLTPLPRETW